MAYASVDTFSLLPIFFLLLSIKRFFNIVVGIFPFFCGGPIFDGMSFLSVPFLRLCVLSFSIVDLGLVSFDYSLLLLS